MPTLIVDNFPVEVYERLQRRAAARRRTVPEEALELLQDLLRQDEAAPRLPDFITADEIIPSEDLPRPAPVGHDLPNAGSLRRPDLLS